MSSSQTQAQHHSSSASSKSSARLSMSANGSVPKKRVAREVRFGAYVLGSTLGEGEFGKVKLGWRKDGKQPSQAAIKLIRRDSIPRGSEKENKIHREINALKKLAHPNIVRLEEVLQNDKYIGIVLEYASGGELFDYILEHRYLKESMACRLFAQLVSGVDYMHSKGIVHRDLKLENLLLDKHKNIIITDFGFVNTFHGADLMKTSCGSPCYAAPELVVSSDPYEGKKVDVWSCGVILYAMLAGYLPFDDDPQNPDGDNIARLYHYITHTPLTFPEYIQPSPRDLLRRVIVSNPNKRIDLKQIRSHQWLSPHAPFLSVTPGEWDKNYKSSTQSQQQQQQQQQIDKSNRRLSLMENPTSASLMFNRPNIKSYSTHNVAAMLYSNPAAPQTSRTVAVPSSSSSTSIKDMAPPPTSSSSSKISSPSATKPQELFRPPHQRTNSAASFVLQAVVEADNFEVSRRNSVSSDGLPRTNIPRSTTHSGVSNESPINTTHHSRSGSMSSAINLPLNFETIAESPEKMRVMNKDTDSMLPPLLPPISKTIGSTIASPASTAGSSSSKLPTRANRPRPTSYHPASTSSGFQFSSPDLTFLLPANTSETSLTRQQLERQHSPRKIATERSSVSSSPIKENRNSWCQSKITEPIVDMSSASGVLTSSSSFVEQPDGEDNSIIPKSEKRKSAALDSLSVAIDLFSLSSKSTTTPNSPTTEDADINNLNEVLIPTEDLTDQKSSVLISTGKVDIQIEVGAGLPSSESTIKVHEDKCARKPSDQEKPPASPASPIPAAVSSNINSNNNINENIYRSPTSKVSKTSIESKHTPATRTRTRNSEKENKSTPSIPTSASTKFKRFSMLGFYSHNNSNNTTNALQNQQYSHRNQGSLSNNSTPSATPKLGSSANFRRPLDSVKDDQLSTYPNLPQESNNESKRMSLAPGVGNGVPLSKQQMKDKEASTAKRVMDFFKRRSVRI